MDLSTNLRSTSKDFTTVIKKIPQVFHEVISMLSSKNVTEKELEMLKKDLLFSILVALTIENGFQVILNDIEVFDPGMITFQYLSKWKLPSGLYKAEFVLSGNSEISVKLMLTPLATNAIVNAVLPEFVSETYSVCLPVDRYFELTKHSTKVTEVCCNMLQLSNMFKNKVLSPVKSKILSLCGYPGPSLLELPEDIFLKIMLYLPIADIISVAKTCTKCNKYLSHNNFWHKLIKRDFDDFISQVTTQSDLQHNWRMSYITSYKSHIQFLEENRRRELMRISRRRQFCPFDRGTSFIL